MIGIVLVRTGTSIFSGIKTYRLFDAAPGHEIYNWVIGRSIYLSNDFPLHKQERKRKVYRKISFSVGNEIRTYFDAILFWIEHIFSVIIVDM